MSDALLAECIARPDDDGPRLVWADAIGGERGELVVVQCTLARGGLTHKQRQELRRREHELLDRHGVEWAGEAAWIAERWSFRRGFVEAASLPHERAGEVPHLRAVAPFVATVSFHGGHGGWVEPALLHGLRGLGLVGDYLGPRFTELAPALASLGLRALALDGLDAGGVQAASALLAASPIETLQLRNLRLSGRQLALLLERVPRLRSLIIDPVELRRELLAVVATRPLRALRIEHVTATELELLGQPPISDSLERLGFVALGTPVLPRLPALQQCEPLADELLHHDPDAVLTLGEARYRRAPTCVLLDLETRELHELVERPAFEAITLGRVLDNAIVLSQPTIARRHAELRWDGHRHVLRDLGSSAGIYVNGERCESAPLVEGDVLQLGNLRFRYFVGPAARERALTDSRMGPAR